MINITERSGQKQTQLKNAIIELQTRVNTKSASADTDDEPNDNDNNNDKDVEKQSCMINAFQNDR